VSIRSTSTFRPETGNYSTYDPARAGAPLWRLLHQLDRSSTSLANVEKILQEANTAARRQMEIIAAFEKKHGDQPLPLGSTRD